MSSGLVKLVSVALVLTVWFRSFTAHPECRAISPAGRSLGLTVEAKLNGSDGGLFKFSSITDSTDSPEDIAIDVKHSVVECGGRKIVRINGTVRDKNRSQVERLVFNPNAGTNVAVINDGRTAVKVNPDDSLNGVVLTNRQLKDNELFEVVLEKKGAKYGQSMGIGMTAIVDEILPHLNRVRTGTWMFYSVDLWKNGVKIKESYGKNIYELVVGDRIGVMRSDRGNIHLFINGVDQGPGGTDVPGNLYGAFELFGSALQVSIISH